ncbi:hypothetical protein D3C77_714260 [compost metagenome]
MHAAPRAVEEPRVALALQGVDAAAEHRLVLVQVEGGARDAAQLCNGKERPPFVQVGGKVQAQAGGFGGGHVGRARVAGRNA